MNFCAECRADIPNTEENEGVYLCATCAREHDTPAEGYARARGDERAMSVAMSVQYIDAVVYATAYAQEHPRTKAEWRAFQARVRASLANSTAHLVRWNMRWCDAIDISLALAPEVAS